MRVRAYSHRPCALRNANVPLHLRRADGHRRRKQALCALALLFGENGPDEDATSHPFCLALLIATVDQIGPALHHTDPSVIFVWWKAEAISAGSEGTQTTLQVSYSTSMTLWEAETLALRTLKHGMEEKLDDTNVELAAMTTKDDTFRMHDTGRLKGCIAQACDRNSWWPFCGFLVFRPCRACVCCRRLYTNRRAVYHLLRTLHFARILAVALPASLFVPTWMCVPSSSCGDALASAAAATRRRRRRPYDTLQQRGYYGY